MFNIRNHGWIGTSCYSSTHRCDDTSVRSFNLKETMIEKLGSTCSSISIDKDVPNNDPSYQHFFTCIKSTLAILDTMWQVKSSKEMTDYIE